MTSDRCRDHVVHVRHCKACRDQNALRVAQIGAAQSAGLTLSDVFPPPAGTVLPGIRPMEVASLSPEMALAWDAEAKRRAALPASDVIRAVLAFRRIDARASRENGGRS